MLLLFLWSLMTRVVNIRSGASYDVYCGRPGRGLDGPFGNPYPKRTVCRRCRQYHSTGGSTLPCFEDYFKERVAKDKAFRAAVLALRDKVLGCFCDDERQCHVGVIIRWLGDNRD